jgi:hypothetical protein
MRSEAEAKLRSPLKESTCLVEVGASDFDLVLSNSVSRVAYTIVAVLGIRLRRNL